jgi:hypothetical protein
MNKFGRVGSIKSWEEANPQNYQRLHSTHLQSESDSMALTQTDGDGKISPHSQLGVAKVDVTHTGQQRLSSHRTNSTTKSQDVEGQTDYDY